jgi:hypothetical protein
VGREVNVEILVEMEGVEIEVVEMDEWARSC